MQTILLVEFNFFEVPLWTSEYGCVRPSERCESTTSGTSGMNVPKFELMVQLTFRIIVAITEVEQEPITKVPVP